MPAKFDRCVRKVKTDGKVDNPFAVCNASLRGKKMKESKILNSMKTKIIERFNTRIEEGFFRELGRGIGGAKRIISQGVTKTGAAMGRAFTNRMAQPGPEGMRKTLSAARALGKEAGKGMISGGRKLFSGALKTGSALYRSAKDSMATRHQRALANLKQRTSQEPKFDNPNPQDFSFGRNEDQLAQDFRNRRRAFRALTKPQNLPKVNTTGEIEGDDEDQNDAPSKSTTASPTAAPSKQSPYAGIESVPSPYGRDEEKINPETGRKQPMRRADYLKNIKIQNDRDRLIGPERDSTQLLGQKIVESMLARVEELSKQKMEKYLSGIEDVKAGRRKRSRSNLLDPQGHNQNVGEKRAKYKIAKINAGNNTPQSVLGSKSKGNAGYIAQNAGERTPAQSPEEINRTGGNRVARIKDLVAKAIAQRKER